MIYTSHPTISYNIRNYLQATTDNTAVASPTHNTQTSLALHHVTVTFGSSSCQTHDLYILTHESVRLACHRRNLTHFIRLFLRHTTTHRRGYTRLCIDTDNHVAVSSFPL